MRNRDLRLVFAGLLLATLALGITTRRIHLGVQVWDKSAGDALYAVAVYFGLAFVAPRTAPLVVALLALSFCIAIELFQLTGVPTAWSRTVPWTHWIFGSSFAWHDLVCYAAGIPLALLGHHLVKGG